MRYTRGLLEPGETIEVRGPGAVAVRRVGEVVAVERTGIRLRQTLRDYTGDPGALALARVRAADGRWVVASEFRDVAERTVVILWRNIAAVEVLEEAAVRAA